MFGSHLSIGKQNEEKKPEKNRFVCSRGNFLNWISFICFPIFFFFLFVCVRSNFIFPVTRPRRERDLSTCMFLFLFYSFPPLVSLISIGVTAGTAGWNSGSKSKYEKKK